MNVHRPEDFIREMEYELRDGYGFIPLVGAGASALGGVPLIQEIERYLARCVEMALRPAGQQFGERELRWNPTRDRWPPFRFDHKEPRDCFNEIYVRYGDLRGKRDPEAPVFQEALGALSNWRICLHFLSRLIPNDEGLAVLGPARPEVIDTFFLHVARQSGARPTFAHRMLAWLASPIRADMIVTTNFDELLEASFHEVGQPLTVYDVHINANLPPHRVCELQRALIKLHGGRYGLRADHTLDESPSEVDRDHFVSYIASQSTATAKSGLGEARRHLLVLGFSGRDERVLGLIRHAARHTSFKIFWVCHSQNDLARVNTLRLQVPKTHIEVCRASHLGLFLLQAYQAITKRIPSSGMLFPSVSHIPMPALAAKDAEKAPDAKVDDAIDSIDGAAREPGARKIVAIVGPEDSLAHFRFAAAVFETMATKNSSVLWLDMDDMASVDDLLEKLLDAVAKQSGLSDWMPLPLESLDDQRLEIKHRVELSRRTWTLFFNCCEGVGTNLKGAPGEPAPSANGWIDLRKTNKKGPSGEKTSTGPEFLDFLTLLCKEETPSLTSVVICNEPAAKTADSFLATLCAREQTEVVKPNPIRGEAKATVERALAWATSKKGKKGEKDESTRRLLFLLALTALRRTRYPELLWSWAFHVREDPAEREGPSARFDLTQQYLKELELAGAIYMKSGGFAWMPRIVRDELHDRLVKEDFFPRKGFEGDAHAALVRMHHGFAEWYMKLYASSLSWEAAFECVYHRCANAREACILARKAKDKKKPLGERANWTRRASESLDAILSTLRMAEPSFLAGEFSRAACRALVHLRHALLAEVRKESMGLRGRPKASPFEKQLSDIAHASVLLNRQVAREVCEHAKAIERHREAENMRASTGIRELGALREEGILYMSARSYEKALDRFTKVYKKAKLPKEVLTELSLANLEETSNENLFRILGEWFTGLAEKRRKNVVLNVVKALRRNVQLLTMISRASYYSRRANERLRQLSKSTDDAERFDAAPALLPWREDHKAYIRKAERYCTITQELLRTLPASATRERTLETMMLKTHQSFIAAAGDDFGRGLLLLNEAEALLGLVGGRGNELQLAVIELHRAEVRTQRAVRGAEDLEKDRGRNPPKKSLIWQRDRVLDGVLSDAPNLPNELAGVLDPRAQFRDGIAYLEDAARALQRAEPLLRANRKNVWWVGWYFNHRLKVAEWLLWASARESKGTIPILGLEDSPEGVPTALDADLAESLRVTRLDVNRLAHAVESYASALLALWIRFEAQRNDGARFSALERRLGAMRKNCLDSCSVLEARRNERRRRIRDVPLDPCVDRYATGVVEVARRIVSVTERREPSSQPRARRWASGIPPVSRSKSRRARAS